MPSRSAAAAGLPERDSKQLGAYYTPPEVVRCLVSWVSAGVGDGSIVDPSCGDGRFLEGMENAVGVDIDSVAAKAAAQATSATIIREDFFSWAQRSDRRFAGAVGNPPFIRYHRFNGDGRERALRYCAAQGVRLSGLCSSWAPFIVGATSLLHEGGRIAFVVPAEIGHAVYARPVLRHLLSSFERVEIIAVREKLFPELSEDCWLLRASGFGRRGEAVHFAKLDSFDPRDDRWVFESVPIPEVERWQHRLRPFLVDRAVRDAYGALADRPGVVRLGDIGKIGIGYVTGANDFFHLRPSAAAELGIPDDLLRVSVRSNRDLAVDDVDDELVASWLRDDRPVLLLDLNGVGDLPRAVADYLESSGGRVARRAYKCRTRQPWFVVPQVRVPDAFLSIMAGGTPRLVRNSARVSCTNSVHALSLTNGLDLGRMTTRWNGPLTAFSCELEGHALGGGLLKIEPAEARRVAVALDVDLSDEEAGLMVNGARELRRWRNADAT